MDLFADIVQPQKPPEPPKSGSTDTSPSHEPSNKTGTSLSPNPPLFFSNPFEPDSRYWRRVFAAFVISVLLNLLLFWMATMAQQLHGFSFKAHPLPKKEITELVLLPQPPPQKAVRRSPVFLETDPSQAVKDRPQDAPFYSEHNTRATQTASSPVISDELPKMDGKNTKTMATETVLPSKSSPPPSPATPDTPKTPTETATSQPQTQPRDPVDTPPAGDLALLKKPKDRPFPRTESPTENTHPNPQPPSHAPPTPPAPDSSRQVLASQTKIAGGVPLVGKAYAFNSAESPFAGYDKKIIGKIGTYWQYQVMNKFYGEKIGEVEISFKLMADGRVTEVQVSRNTAGPVLAGWCLQAIQKSAPFDPFPESMKAIAGEFREGAITFAY